MSHNVSRFLPGALSGADLSSSGKGRFGTIGTGKQVTVVGTRGARADGVIMDGPSAAGEAIRFATQGVVEMYCDDTVTDGAIVTSSADGQVTNADTTGDHVLGVALSGGDAGDIIEVELQYQGTVA